MSDRLVDDDNWLEMLSSIPGAAFVIMERRWSFYRNILLGMVSGESRARRADYLKESARSFMENGL